MSWPTWRIWGVSCLVAALLGVVLGTTYVAVTSYPWTRQSDTSALPAPSERTSAGAPTVHSRSAVPAAPAPVRPAVPAAGQSPALSSSATTTATKNRQAPRSKTKKADKPAKSGQQKAGKVKAKVAKVATVKNQ